MREIVRYGILKAGTNVFYSGGTTRLTVDEKLTLKVLRKASRTLQGQPRQARDGHSCAIGQYRDSAGLKRRISCSAIPIAGRMSATWLDSCMCRNTERANRSTRTRSEASKLPVHHVARTGSIHRRWRRDWRDCAVLQRHQGRCLSVHRDRR